MMPNSYSSLCDDFYLDMYINTELELPTGRDTILSFFERIQKQFPSMGRFYRRENNEYYLEEDRNPGQYRWVSLEIDRIGSGVANPSDFETVYFKTDPPLLSGQIGARACSLYAWGKSSRYRFT